MPRNDAIERQWRLLRALEHARRGLTAAELHADVAPEVGVRTVYRDLELLARVGMPVHREGGRWRLLGGEEGGWSVPVKPTHVLALALSEDLLAPLGDAPAAASLRDLRRRVRAMLTPEGRRYCDLLRRHAVATLHGPGDLSNARGVIENLEWAAENEQRARIRYATPGKAPADRVVDPYCTWYETGRLYLIAWDHRSEDWRHFNVQRIHAADVLDETFEPDPSFDAAAYARKSFGVFHGPVYRVAIDFAARVSHLVRERRFHHSQRVVPRGEGVRFTMEAAGLPEIAAWVAGFGGDAVPVAPPELVAMVRELHERGLAAMR